MTKDLTTNECKPSPMAPLMPTAADPSYFSHFPWSIYHYPLATDRNQPMFSATFDNLQQQVYSGPGHRWPGAEAYSDGKAWIDPPLWAPTFPLPPPAMEPCPVDPCPSTVPSTSVAQSTFEYKPLEYKPLDYMMGRASVNSAAYQYNMLPYTDFTSPQAHAAITANWKAAAMKGSAGGNKGNGGIPPPKHRTGPGTNNVRVRTQDTYRVVYTDAQRTHLELEYQAQQFITSERKAELSGRLNLTERQVKIWFQNRRAKDRRDKRNSPSKQMI